MADEADVPEGPEDGPDDDVAAEADADAVEEASADSGARGRRDAAVVARAAGSPWGWPRWSRWRA